jgi:hypothetical protein
MRRHGPQQHFRVVFPQADCLTIGPPGLRIIPTRKQGTAHALEYPCVTLANAWRIGCKQVWSSSP